MWALTEREVPDMEEYMSGKEVVNLIIKLKEEGMSAERILDIIEYIETHDPADRNNENK